jgi:hypothetical protein
MGMNIEKVQMERCLVVCMDFEEALELVQFLDDSIEVGLSDQTKAFFEGVREIASNVMDELPCKQPPP